MGKSSKPNGGALQEVARDQPTLGTPVTTRGVLRDSSATHEPNDLAHARLMSEYLTYRNARRQKVAEHLASAEPEHGSGKTTKQEVAQQGGNGDTAGENDRIEDLIKEGKTANEIMATLKMPFRLRPRIYRIAKQSKLFLKHDKTGTKSQEFQKGTKRILVHSGPLSERHAIDRIHNNILKQMMKLDDDLRSCISEELVQKGRRLTLSLNLTIPLSLDRPDKLQDREVVNAARMVISRARAEARKTTRS